MSTIHEYGTIESLTSYLLNSRYSAGMGSWGKTSKKKYHVDIYTYEYIYIYILLICVYSYESMKYKKKKKDKQRKMSLQ